MKIELEQKLKQFVVDYQTTHQTKSAWKEPLIAYASSLDPAFQTLKESVQNTHALPTDLLPGAKSVVVYFLPFANEISVSNIPGRLSSPEWALAYIVTNQLISDLNTYMKEELEAAGYPTNATPATHNFDPKTLLSDWSHRHVALIAGLGTFGLNNMLITEKGCCGRLGSFVTTLPLEPSPRIEKEYCLYKSRQICKKCVDRCVTGALQVDSFDRHLCYEICLENDRYHDQLGLTDVCGKCLVQLPCSFKNPMRP